VKIFVKIYCDNAPHAATSPSLNALGRLSLETTNVRDPNGAVTDTAAEIVGRYAVGTSISLPSSSVCVS
jgi:hypothetical protein